jgi:hypothetical protein
LVESSMKMQAMMNGSKTSNNTEVLVSEKN